MVDAVRSDNEVDVDAAAALAQHLTESAQQREELLDERAIQQRAQGAPTRSTDRGEKRKADSL